MQWQRTWDEDTSGVCWRVCPACEAPLRWIEYAMPHLQQGVYRVLKMVEYPVCSSGAHGIFGWWLIRNREGLILGRASLNDGRRLPIYGKDGRVVKVPRYNSDGSPMLNEDGSPAVRSASYVRNSKLYSRPRLWERRRGLPVLLGDPTPWCGRWRRQLAESKKAGNNARAKSVRPGRQGVIPF